MKRIGIAVTDPGDWTAIALNDALVKASVRPVVFRLHDVTTSIQEHNRIYAGNTDLGSLDALIVRDVGGAGGVGVNGSDAGSDVGIGGGAAYMSTRIKNGKRVFTSTLKGQVQSEAKFYEVLEQAIDLA